MLPVADVRRVVHDVNNLLAVVVGDAEVLRLTSSDPMAVELAAEMLDAGERASRLLADLADLAEPVAGA